jgi:hypothetical protein
MASSRRRLVLAGLGVAAALLAGCSGSASGPARTVTVTRSAPVPGSSAPTSSTPSAGPSLDLPPTPPDPADLDPTPQQALKETNQASLDGCELPESSTKLAPECLYLPDQGVGDVILFGDSHAAQWLPAVRSVASAHQWGLRVWTRANCPVADITKMSGSHPNDDCTRWRDDAVRRVLAAKPSLLVVAGYPPPGGPATLDPGTGRAASTARAITLYEQGMAASLKTFTTAGIRVLYIFDQPRFDTPAGTCIEQHPNDFATACTESRDVNQHAPTDAAAAAQVPAVHTLDLTDVYCSATRCRQVVGNVIVYRDNNHLSPQMATALTPLVKPAMEAAAR